MNNQTQEAKHLFFIALLPPDDMQQEITRFKTICAQQLDASYALKTPPHITLIPPFRLTLSAIDNLKETLRRFANLQSTFGVSLNNFGFFEPRVVYVDVVKNDMLINLQQQLFISMGELPELSSLQGNRFVPHITIAHRDLKKIMFYRAYRLFSEKTFQATFLSKKISLMEHLDGRWKIMGEFSFKMS